MTRKVKGVYNDTLLCEVDGERRHHLLVRGIAVGNHRDNIERDVSVGAKRSTGGGERERTRQSERRAPDVIFVVMHLEQSQAQRSRAT